VISEHVCQRSLREVPDGGLILSLYPRSELAKDARIPRTPPTSGEFSIGHIVRERSEVDALLEPHERPWGIYSGYFRDPDGHLWEIIWNPRPSAAAVTGRLTATTHSASPERRLATRSLGGHS
jgi:hypothetical protein